VNLVQAHSGGQPTEKIVMPTSANMVHFVVLELVWRFGPGGKCTRKGQPIGTAPLLCPPPQIWYALMVLSL